MSASVMFKYHTNFVCLAVLMMALCLGGGRLVSLLNNDDVKLLVGSAISEVKLIAATDSGLLFVSSKDANYIKLMFGGSANFFLMSDSGHVTCFGKVNTLCSPDA